MRILYSWLAEFIEQPPSPEDLAIKLGRIGLKVEELRKTGASFSGVCVGQILKIDKHPNADKLALVDVTDGLATLRVVCGAKNIAVGQKIPFARVGAMLAEGELKRARIRGVDSEGMICSAAELGLEGYDSTGILVLPDAAVAGADAAALFPKAEHVLEVEMLPNQAHCLSHYALAREVCVFYGLTLKEPDVTAAGAQGTVVPVTISVPELCPRYDAIVIRGVKDVATPGWMAERLRAVGCNPKGNLLVDGSNYVMYELGQPTHCFDVSRLSGPAINVRRAMPGETFRTLDNKELKLDPGMMVIADASKPAALAGVMGGLDTAVSETTDELLIESARFNPPTVRLASKITGIKSESSYRFERGTDPELTMKAARRLAGLILAAAPGAVILQVSSACPVKYVPPVVEVLPERINTILGTGIADGEIFACLRAFQPATRDAKPWVFSVPSYRQDIESVWDVAEEVARYIGYNVIPAVSRMPMLPSAVTPNWAVGLEMKNTLAALGFSEVYNYDFICAKELKASALDLAAAVELKNPLSSDFQYLRQTMLPGLLKTLRYNLNRGREAVMVFETGTVYAKKDAAKTEEVYCAGLMFGDFPEGGFWQGGQDTANFYHLKGMMSRLFAGKGGFRFEKPKNLPGYFQPGFCLEMKLGGGSAGYLGRVNPAAAAAFDFKDNNIYYFEIPLASLVAAWKPEFWQRIAKIKPVSAFPQNWRDLSVVLEDKHEWAELERSFSGVQDLASARLIDVFKGKNIPAGFKSLTARFTFSSMTGTLTDAEVGARMTAILDKLSKNFGAKLRS
ncbi:MAG: phenylalanine--tRNA ligase subunit beta [Elusimicrobia bacterium RIFOXYA2_FULL_58_8]|nr:MAG: phenylalanine--tRNA ligase subunit beta [Elusimicrobia bacterium RIFOXYA12_FULL_57_11]OGS17275.1 MAG: phenylalanine--tRNA ligase subunit beta [Elusimicrobia bacterium RIFOXYA2_FULL_58_8]